MVKISTIYMLINERGKVQRLHLLGKPTQRMIKTATPSVLTFACLVCSHLCCAVKTENSKDLKCFRELSNPEGQMDVSTC